MFAMSIRLATTARTLQRGDVDFHEAVTERLDAVLLRTRHAFQDGEV